ncbi:MAG: hypothetical protein M1833_003544 [Piccolia ochrophora]|nr:MAG: hypothetical protein M1833_003544 [Piccolia ochrophora]
MPKKYHRPLPSKPPSTSHPSISSSSLDPPRPPEQSNNSVNEQLTALRKSQASPPEPGKSPPVSFNSSRTVHPSLQAILDVPMTPPPTPRPGMRGTPRPRGPPGPPPPSSWLVASRHCPAHMKRQHRERASRAGIRTHNTAPLPDMTLPSKTSLQHMALKRMAEDWDFHRHYDQHYLAALTPQLKSLLLWYISFYGPEDGVAFDGLKVLFRPSTEVQDATSNDEITHLDLSGAIARSVTLRQLEFFLSPPPPFPIADTTPVSDSPPDDWSNPTNAPLLASPTTLLPSLTHLSLSFPHPSSSWSRLLALKPHLATLTHLSLAHWPIPTLTPNSKTTTITTTSSSSPSTTIRYGGSDYYSASEGDWAEAAGILRRLSRATYCLTWLDVSGCADWWDALGWKVAGEGADWTGAWRGLRIVRMSMGGQRRPSSSSTSFSSTTTISGGTSALSSTHDEAWPLRERKRREDAQRSACNVAAWVRRKKAAHKLPLTRFQTDWDVEGNGPAKDGFLTGEFSVKTVTLDVGGAGGMFWS